MFNIGMINLIKFLLKYYTFIFCVICIKFTHMLAHCIHTWNAMKDEMICLSNLSNGGDEKPIAHGDEHRDNG